MLAIATLNDIKDIIYNLTIKYVKNVSLVNIWYGMTTMQNWDILIISNSKKNWILQENRPNISLYRKRETTPNFERK